MSEGGPAGDRASIESELRAWRAEAVRQEALARDLLRSRSWRLTRPLRALAALLPRRRSEPSVSAEPEPASSSPRWPARRRPGLQVLIIDHRLPTPAYDTASQIRQLILDALLREGCALTFMPADGVLREPACSHLRSVGVEIIPGDVNRMRELAAIGPGLDLVITCLPTLSASWLEWIKRVAPQAALVYDMVESHFLHARSRAEAEGVREPPVVDVMRALEALLAQASDLTICVSDEEAELLLESAPGARVEVLPPIQDVVNRAAPLSGREGLLFVGTYDHPPNVDAMRWLAEEIMPLVWAQRPEAVLRIAGGSVQPERGEELIKEIEAHASERFRIEGWVEDLDALIDRSRVSVAPMRFGAGVRGKVTEALARGLPVVSTSQAMLGGAEKAGALLVAEDAEAFAGQILRLLGDDELWQRVSSTGLRFAQEHLTKTRLDPVVRSLLELAAGARFPGVHAAP